MADEPSDFNSLSHEQLFAKIAENAKEEAEIKANAAKKNNDSTRGDTTTTRSFVRVVIALAVLAVAGLLIAVTK